VGVLSGSMSWADPEAMSIYVLRLRLKTVYKIHVTNITVT